MSLPFCIKKIYIKFQTKVLKVEIKKCVHYCGFKYGSSHYNPYETYVIDLHHQVPEAIRENKFIDFLMYYRPQNFGEALGIKLTKDYPLWQFPWSKDLSIWYNATKLEIKEIPDILTHFSEDGIPFDRIKEEFGWLESAYTSIKYKGYQPKIFGYAEVLCLMRGEEKMYLMLDGNHRVSALCALGVNKIKVKLHKSNIIRRENFNEWYGVRSGFYIIEDALKIFDLYFEGNRCYNTTRLPAKIIY